MNDWKCTRRTFIKTAGWVTVAAAGGLSLPEAFASSSPQAVPNSSGTEASKFKAPANACDCHIHIFDDHFLMTGPTDSYVPNSSVASYRLFMQRIGTSRVVVVTPRPYVTDNRCTTDAIAQIGLSNARGVAVVHPEVTDEELKTLADQGIRGIRFTLQSSTASVTSASMIEPLAKRINDLGWHLQFHLQAKQFVEHEELLNRIAAPMVFDHMGRLSQINHPAFKIICRLIDKGRTWIKLSGAYMESKIGAPNYADTSEVARAFIKVAPERMVWGSNWPHPTEKKTKPDDAVLFDLLPAWVPDDALRRRILVDNPAVLYGFAK